MKDLDSTGKSLYFVRALSYCDINKIDIQDLKETLKTYPEFAQDFMDRIQVTFNLKRVDMSEVILCENGDFDAFVKNLGRRQPAHPANAEMGQNYSLFFFFFFFHVMGPVFVMILSVV